MYSAVLSYERRPQLRMIEKAHQFVLGRVLAAVQTLLPEASQQGTSDLALSAYKVSGNSLRCRRTHLLYHGTLLYDFPLELIQRYLKMPPRQPEYRDGRQHQQFVRNLPVPATKLRRALVDQWQIDGDFVAWPHERTEQLVSEKYSQDSWNLRL